MNTFLSCSHRRTTFPMTVLRSTCASSAARFVRRTYVVCLDCGKEFSYNWRDMRIEMAKPLVDSRIQQIAALWFASMNSFLARRNMSTKLKSAVMSIRIALEALARACKRLALPGALHRIDTTGVSKADIGRVLWLLTPISSSSRPRDVASLAEE